MLIVGKNLEQLVEKYRITENIKDVDTTCIELRLDRTVKRLCATIRNRTLRYGERIPGECIKVSDIGKDGLLLRPAEPVLACSQQKIVIPPGYMGLVQTKGSLARMFVFAQFSDAQIDSGFSGKITLELFNASPFNILIQEGQKIANLYIIKASDKNVKLYEGKYQYAQEPTIQIP